MAASLIVDFRNSPEILSRFIVDESQIECESFETFDEKVCKANSEQSFWRRVRTFAKQRTLLLSPLTCARHGWIFADENRLQCVSCKAMVSCHVPRVTDATVISVCTRRLLLKLTQGHNQHCFWQFVPSPVTLMWPPFHSANNARELFQTRVRSLLQVGLDLPRVVEHPGLDIFIYDLTELVIDSSLDSELLKTAVTLAVSGWIADCNSVRSSWTISCTHCFRTVGLWNFLSLNTVERIADISTNNDCCLPPVINDNQSQLTANSSLVAGNDLVDILCPNLDIIDDNSTVGEAELPVVEETSKLDVEPFDSSHITQSDCNAGPSFLDVESSELNLSSGHNAQTDAMESANIETCVNLLQDGKDVFHEASLQEGDVDNVDSQNDITAEEQSSVVRFNFKSSDSSGADRLDKSLCDIPETRPGESDLSFHVTVNPEISDTYSSNEENIESSHQICKVVLTKAPDNDSGKDASEKSTHGINEQANEENCSATVVQVIEPNNLSEHSFDALSAKRRAAEDTLQSTTKRAKRMLQFAPLQQHRSWCIWVCDSEKMHSDPFAEGLTSDCQVTFGWQKFVNLLIKKPDQNISHLDRFLQAKCLLQPWNNNK